MKRELKLAIGGNVIGLGIIVVFFTVLEMLTPMSILAEVGRCVPAMFMGIIGGLIGTYIAMRRKPDERMQLILKQSAQNAFWAILLTLPFVSLAFMFLPTQTGIVYGIWMWGLWMIGVVVFYLSAIYYYYS